MRLHGIRQRHITLTVRVLTLHKTGHVHTAGGTAVLFLRAGWIALFTASDRSLQRGGIMSEILYTRVRANPFVLMGYLCLLTLLSLSRPSSVLFFVLLIFFKVAYDFKNVKIDEAKVCVSVCVSSFRGRERAIVNQTNIRTVSNATLGTLSWETELSAYRLPRAHRYHLELN